MLYFKLKHFFSLHKLDLEFGKLTGGKTDLFLRKWEASIIPKLKSVAALETRMSSLLKDFEEKTEGIPPPALGLLLEIKKKRDDQINSSVYCL